MTTLPVVWRASNSSCASFILSTVRPTSLFVAIGRVSQRVGLAAQIGSSDNLTKHHLGVQRDVLLHDGAKIQRAPQVDS